jgi:hypothetical protein
MDTVSDNPRKVTSIVVGVGNVTSSPVGKAQVPEQPVVVKMGVKVSACALGAQIAANSIACIIHNDFRIFSLSPGGVLFRDVRNAFIL